MRENLQPRRVGERREPGQGRAEGQERGGGFACKHSTPLSCRSGDDSSVSPPHPAEHFVGLVLGYVLLTEA